MVKYTEKSKSYFIGFPQVQYKLPEIDEIIAVQNFLKHFSFRSSIKDNPMVYSQWIIRDEDTIYSIAHKLYDSTHYYWIIAALNNLINPDWSWPFKDKELIDYVDTKYGVANRTSVHHLEATGISDGDDLYDLPDGIWVDEWYSTSRTPNLGVREVTNLEYELKKNDERRRIKLFKPEYLAKVEAEKKSIMESKFSRITRV